MANKGSGKTRRGFYLEDWLLEQADGLFQEANVESRSEFLNNALKFYIGYLTSKRIENYMLTTISSVMHAMVKDTENRIARILFKLAVESAKVAHVTAYGNEVDEETLKKLHVKCVEEVKKINGAVTFEETYAYQSD